MSDVEKGPIPWTCTCCSVEVEVGCRYCQPCAEKLSQHNRSTAYKPIDLANSDNCYFELQNSYKEVKRAIKVKEESGFFKGHPERVQQAKEWLSKYEHLKGQRGTDYQKERHPLDD